MMQRIGKKHFLIPGFSALLLVLCTSVADAQQPLRGSTDLRPETQAARNVPRQQTDPRALQMQQNVQQRALQQQQALQQQRAFQQQGALQQQQAVANQAPAAANQAPAAQGAQPAQPATRPFPPLDAAQNERLQKLLSAWEQQSKATKTLTCSFEKWHFDTRGAPAGIHAQKSSGQIKYAKPDQGLFRTDELLFFSGMKEGKPQFAKQDGKFGDYWVCNGREVTEYDGNIKTCTISALPPGMQGQEIFNSPLPFVFNLDAQRIQQRYWVREQKAPKEGMFLIEAWPKNQADRAQYKLVQIALDDKKFLPTALIMYAPNFNAKTAPMWDVYEFKQVKQNAIGAALQKFMTNFIPKRPPAGWQIVRETLPMQNEAPQRQAEAPQGGQRK